MTPFAHRHSVVLISAFVLLLLPVLSPWAIRALATTVENTAPTVIDPLLNSLTAQEISWLKDHPSITAGTMSGWPPFNFVDDAGQPRGIGADIIQQINQRLGNRLIIKPGQWKDLLQAVKTRELDIVLDITPNSSRDPFYNFTKPYLDVPHVIVANKDTAFINSEAELAGKTLALEKGFGNVKYFQNNHPEVKLELYENTSSALEAVSRGDVAAYAGNRVVAIYLIELNALSNLKVHGRLSKSGSILTLGTRKDYVILRDILQKALDDISVSGLRKIKNQWIYGSSVMMVRNELVLSEQEKAWIASHPNIEIGVDGNWPPIDFIDKNKQFHGITADYLELISKKTGLTFIPQKSENFKTMLARVMQGTLKAGASISFKKERAEKLWFSEPFFHVHKAIMVQNQRNDINTIKDLYGKTVAIEDGFLTMRQLQDLHPEIKLSTFNSTLEALKAVSFDKADAYVGNQAVAAWLSQKNQITNLKLTGDPGLGSGPQNFAVSKKAPEWKPLIGIIDKVLTSLTPGEITSIEKRWLGSISPSVKTVTPLELSNSEKAWVEQHQDIRLGIDAAWEPMEFIDSEGEYRGLSSEFMGYFLTQLGIRYEQPQKLPWSDVLSGLKQQTIDLAPMLTKTESRQQYLDFTDPYLNFPVVIFNQQGQTLLNGLPDLIDKKVGVVKGYAISELIERDYPTMQRQFFTSTLDGLKALSLGEVDAFIDLLAVGGYLISTNGLNNIQVAASTPYAHDFSIGIRKDWPELTSLLNRAIKQLPAEQKNAFLRKWLALNYEQKIDYTLLMWVIGIALIIFLILAIRARDMSRLNLKLNQAHQAVLKASDFKSSFLANMSHEIRTPMNAIVGLGHLLSRTELSHQQQDYINNLQKSAQTLLGLVDDILDISKIEAGHLKIDLIEFKLEQLLNDLTGITQIRLRNHDIEFIYDLDDNIPAYLIGDPFRINQILTNLLTNAIKFTSSGNIILKITTLDIHDSKTNLRFELSDTGIGIKPEKLKSLFSPFIQEDSSTTREFGGTGLGLSISRHLSELMGGSLDARSTVGQGSTFFFTLPFEIPAHHKEAQKLTPRSDLRNLNVLLVDDNPDALKIMASTLESMTFRVTRCSNGRQALHILEQAEEAFDLVLLDWRMPEQDGEQTSALIRQRLPADQLPIIIMITAYGRDIAEQNIDRSSIDGLLIKPITPSQVFDAIMEIKGSSGSETGPDELLTVDEASQPPLSGHILLAEDNPINQQVAEELLSQMGLKVSISNNGIEVLEYLKSNTPDLVLMDIQMPKMDGYQAAQKIRAQSEFKNMPIIAMTANALKEDQMKSAAIGMNAHINKPVDPDALYQTLQQFLHSRENPVDSSTTSPESRKLLKWPDEIPGLNIRKGIKQVGGNEVLYQKLLKDFFNNHGQLGKQIMEHIKNHDLKSAALEIHTIKGVSGNIGANRLHESTSLINNLLENENTIDPEVLNELDSACNELCGNLEKLFLQECQSQAEVADEATEKITDQDMKKLLSALANGDTQALKQVEELSSALKIYLGIETFEKLTEALQDFDFDQAESLIKEPMEQKNGAD